jgi:hypothetical protein
MKTTMQELIEELRSLAFTELHLGTGDIVLTQGHIDELEEKYLKKEKELLKETWFRSTAQFDNAAQMTYKKLFEEYYNETYNQNK